MPKGSGIATYARNLNHTLRTIGINTQILYGPDQGPGEDALLNEISLFDAPPPPSAMRWASSAWRDFKSLASPLGRRAEPVSLSGALITRHVAQNAPPCDGVWTG